MSALKLLSLIWRSTKVKYIVMSAFSICRVRSLWHALERAVALHPDHVCPQRDVHFLISSFICRPYVMQEVASSKAGKAARAGKQEAGDGGD